jgi:hypothetical protein
MDHAKMAKLLDYARLLAKEGASFEKEGDDGAIPKYIKVVDILLLLAESAPSYPEWTNYVSKAEFYQKRTKILLSKIAMRKREGDESNLKTKEKETEISSEVSTPPH